MIIDGKLVSKIIKSEIKEEVSNLKKTYKEEIVLLIIQVGNNDASNIYIRNKERTSLFCGIKCMVVHYDETITENELIQHIEEFNNDISIHGIIVQLPLPKSIEESKVINAIDKFKDVDGFGIDAKGRLFTGVPSFICATPLGIMRLFEYYNINLDGMHSVVVGRSNIVGKPMSELLLSKNATVTICHSHTKNLKDICKQADLLIVAIGKAKFITKDYVKEGAIVVDVGMNRENGELCGDVSFDEVAPICSYITPVPGGCGPMTVVSLIENTLKAYKLSKR